MKSFFLSIISVLFLSIVALAAIGAYAAHQYLKPNDLQTNKLVLIERGQGVSTIAQTLQNAEIINQPTLFKIAARFKDSLKAGEYDFPAHITMAEVIEMMQAGDVFDRKITIPEGLTSYQIVKLLKAQDDLKGAITGIPKEGSLMPDTYHYTIGTTRGDLIAQMQNAADKALNTLWENRADDLPLKTKQDALILASIVEKETGIAGERHRVAGVFINRLKKGMPLQTDPTVIYALTNGVMKDEGKGPLGRRLLRKDLQFKSPYNTYLNAGLPPTPIANAGYGAIEATLNPENHDYIYFVADGTGGHAFGKTLAEHNRNVAKWRKIRSQ